MYVIRLEIKIKDYGLVKSIIDLVRDVLGKETLQHFSIEVEAEG